MILEVKGLQKHFPLERGLFRPAGGVVKAVDDVSFSLSSGETLGIVGESGCGKTTLVKLLLKLLEPTGGIINFYAPIEQLRRDVSIVFQDPLLSLDPKMRLKDCLLEPLLAQGIRHGVQDRIEEVMRAVGLSGDILARLPARISGGQRQRVCIARSLICKPKLLILDEPLSSLDLVTQKQILELLRGLKQEFHITYIFISHNIAVVKKIASRVLVMREGKIVEQGAAQEVFSRPQAEYTKKLLEAAG